MKNNQSNPSGENKIMLRHKLLLCLIALLMVPLFFVAKTMFAGIAQTGSKREKIIKKVSYENEPIEFLSLESNGENIKPNKKFVRGDNWLENFKIKFKNISSKPIVYVSIAMLFPETGSVEPPRVYFLRYGINPEINAKDKPILLSRDDAAEVKFTQEDLNHLKTVLSEGQRFSELTEADFRIMSVYFEDGTKWAGGTFYRPDPTNVRKFVPVDKEPMEEKK